MKHVLITGGSEGIGKVAAGKLIEAGYKVTILSHNETKLKATAKELGCDYVVADVSDYAQVKKAIDRAKQTAPIDILINNAGVWEQGLLETNTPEQIERTIMVNTVGPMYCTHALVKDFKSRKSGRIIFVDSQAGLQFKAERSIYIASKWGLTGFIRSMQAELRSSMVCVDAVFPGAVKDTALFDHHKEHRSINNALTPENIADAILYICGLPNTVNVRELGLENIAD
jgi:NADP-dependent 3-hydroxy acid dehydrogenase YdfG